MSSINPMTDTRSPKKLHLKPNYASKLSQITATFSGNRLLMEQQLKYIRAMPLNTYVSIIGWSQNQYLKAGYAQVKQPKNLIESSSVFTCWANDLTIGDEEIQLCPWTEAFLKPVLQRIHAGGQSLYLTMICFSGGNIVIAELNKQIKVLCGQNVFDRNRNFYSRGGVHPGYDFKQVGAFEKYFTQVLVGHQACVIGQQDPNKNDIKQPWHLYHLDLWILPVGPNHLAVLDPNCIEPNSHLKGRTKKLNQKRRNEFISYLDFCDLPEMLVDRDGNLEQMAEFSLGQKAWQDVLKEHEKLECIYHPQMRHDVLTTIKNHMEATLDQLKALGFTITYLMTSNERILRFMSDANVIVDNSGLLIRASFDAKSEVEQENTKIFKGLGFEPKAVHDQYTHFMHGGPKCYFNRARFWMPK